MYFHGILDILEMTLKDSGSPYSSSNQVTLLLSGSRRSGVYVQLPLAKQKFSTDSRCSVLLTPLGEHGAVICHQLILMEVGVCETRPLLGPVDLREGSAGLRGAAVLGGGGCSAPLGPFASPTSGRRGATCSTNSPASHPLFRAVNAGAGQGLALNGFQDTCRGHRSTDSLCLVP